MIVIQNGDFQDVEQYLFKQKTPLFDNPNAVVRFCSHDLTQDYK